jgi:hypothetical protein
MRTTLALALALLVVSPAAAGPVFELLPSAVINSSGSHLEDTPVIWWAVGAGFDSASVPLPDGFEYARIDVTPELVGVPLVINAENADSFGLDWELMHDYLNIHHIQNLGYGGYIFDLIRYDRPVSVRRFEKYLDQRPVIDRFEIELLSYSTVPDVANPGANRTFISYRRAIYGSIPEPSSALLLGSTLMGLLFPCSRTFRVAPQTRSVGNSAWRL